MVYAQPSICPGEWDTKGPMEFWHINGSPNFGQTTRPYNSQQKKTKKNKNEKQKNKKKKNPENLQNCELYCPGWPQSKIEQK